MHVLYFGRKKRDWQSRLDKGQSEDRSPSIHPTFSLLSTPQGFGTMKWVTFISLIFLFSSAYSRGVFRRDTRKNSIFLLFNFYFIFLVKEGFSKP